ncbi:KTSC domain-containing protein [Mesorhizobium sp.]|uniref:KTSC domain-containing protein n=1 Tax=Mesorhizobium sp. TaxID=1871066 RepID=UPI000FE6C68F|nr:KTSC domain-containing protein [Mesorhizobium sp.]RWO61784.1 MAG: KTSC domain-containing protein [Mesorhizobium sp.]
MVVGAEFTNRLLAKHTASKEPRAEQLPPETFAAFKAAFAKGRYFNEHIPNHFRYRLVGPAVD